MIELFGTLEAIQDRDDIYDYVEADKTAAALDLDDLFEKKLRCCSIIHTWTGWAT